MSQPWTSAESVRAFALFLLRLEKQRQANVYQDSPTSPEALFSVFHQESQAPSGGSVDWHAVLVFWWDLARTGAVAIVGGGGSNDRGFPRYVMTEFGRSLLEQKDVSPHDRAGYLSAIRGAPGADAIAVGYADEAVGAWQARLYRASAVMLGCACERLVIVIAEAVSHAGISPYSQKLQIVLAPPKDKPPAGISEVFKQIRGAVLTLDGESDSFDRDVSAIFQHARSLRNDSGHPSGREVTQEVALAGLLLFPGFHKRALDLVRRVRSPGT